MRQLVNWVGLALMSLLVVAILVIFLLPMIFGSALPWIKEGEGLGTPDRDCGLLQEVEYSDGYAVFFLLGDNELHRVVVSPDMWPIRVEEGVSLEHGEPICLVVLRNSGGFPKSAYVEPRDG